MHMLALSFALAVTSSDHFSHETAVAYQCTLMRDFFSTALPEWLTAISRHQVSQTSEKASTHEVCGGNGDPIWVGMTCVDGLLTELQMHIKSPGQLRIRYLPPTLEVFSVTICSQQYGVSTRHLPRKLLVFNMRRNDLIGGIELKNLPPAIKVVNVNSNYISGPIDIRHVPASLTELDMGNNRLNQKIIFHGEFSALIEKIDFRNNGVKKVLPEVPQYAASAKHVEVLI